MHAASIACLSSYTGKIVQVKAWVYNLRSSGKIGFLIIRDGSGWCQCVVRADKGDKNNSILEVFNNLKQEDCIVVKGEVQKHQADLEIHVQHISKLSSNERSQSEKTFIYPLGKKDHGIDFLLNHRHLWLRSRRPWAVLRIRHTITRAIHNFFAQKDFIQVDAPSLTPTACEESSSLFPVRFFNKEDVYLSQSGQLYMEAAAAAFGKVYCFNPVFRSEKSSTRRHLLEFWMVEPEMAFYDLNQCMELVEELIEYVISQVLQQRQKELDLLGVDQSALKKITVPFPRLSYEKACQILKEKKPSEDKIDSTTGLGGEDETILSSCFEKPVFIHRYPLAAKAFYMKTDPENNKYSLSFDLLGTQGYGELVGGSEREDDLNVLEKKMQQHQLEKKLLEWYLDLRKYGTFPHSGFGLGVERMLSWVCNLSHVRESIAFPRMYGRAFF